MISSRSFLWAKAEMPPSLKGSSYQKKSASSQALPTLSVSPQVSYSQAGSSIRSIAGPTRLRVSSTLAASRSMYAPSAGSLPQPWILNAG